MIEDALSILPPFQWRGKSYPVTARSVSFAHEAVQHKLQRRNQDLVEQTGAHNLVFSYTIPMRQGIYKGPYSDLFPVGLAQILSDFKDKSEGDLVDQLYGPYRCVPASWLDETDVLKRDGTELRLEFLESPTGEDDQPPVASESTLNDDGRNIDVAKVELAEAAVTEREKIAIQEFEQFEAERGETDILSAINGVGRQVLNQFSRIQRAAAKVAFRAHKLEDTANEFKNPVGYRIVRKSRAVREHAYQVSRGRSRVSIVKNVILKESMSMTTLANKYGVSLAALIEANPNLINKPSLSAGTIVIIPSGKS